MKKKKLILAITVCTLILLALLAAEEHKPYEIFHSTVMSSPNLTQNEITLVIHTLLPIDEEELARAYAPERRPAQPVSGTGTLPDRTTLQTRHSL